MSNAPSALALAVLALASVPSAQYVLVVDDSGGASVDFTSIADAVAVAAAGDGDVVLVRTGSYAGDVVVDGKSLVLTADTDAAVDHHGRLAVQNLAAAGGTGLAVQDGAQAELLGTLLQGGPPGPLGGPGTCTQGPPGAPSAVQVGATLVESAWPAVDFVMSTPVRSDGTVVLAFEGAPGDALWLAVSAAAGVLPLPAAAGSVLVASPIVVSLGVLGASGAQTLELPTFVPPGFESFVYHAQALFFDGVRATLSEPAHVVELAPGVGG